MTLPTSNLRFAKRSLATLIGQLHRAAMRLGVALMWGLENATEKIISALLFHAQLLICRIRVPFVASAQHSSPSAASSANRLTGYLPARERIADQPIALRQLGGMG